MRTIILLTMTACLSVGQLITTAYADSSAMCAKLKIKQCDLAGILGYAKKNGFPVTIKAGPDTDESPISSEGLVCSKAIREGGRTLWICLEPD